MKKYFKSPEEAGKSDAKSVMKVLKKVFDKGVEGDKFFYKAEFNYENGEIAPFLYIGPPAGPWKKYIKDSKKDKDFSAGLCKLEIAESGDKELKLLPKIGKGDKPLFLKAVNKELLKRLGVKAEFVSELAVQIAEEEEEDAEDYEDIETVENTDETTEGVPSTEQNESTNKLKEKAKAVSELIKNFELTQSTYDRALKEKLFNETKQWLIDYKTLDVAHKDTLKKHALKTNQIFNQIKEKIEVDNEIDRKMDIIMENLDSYLALDSLNSSEALSLAKKIAKKLSKIEEHASFVKDKELQEECSEIRALLV